MSWKTIAAVARAEARSVRRLVRFWIFVTLASFLGIVGYLYYAAIHGFFSAYSGSVGATNPEYMVSPLGWWYLLVFTVGMIFMAFDVRDRDRRERMVEVLDSRPYSNPELVVGRFLGILVPSWIPVVVLALAFWAIGWLGRQLGWPFGEPPLFGYLVALAVPMAIPALSFFLAFTFVVSLAVRSRLVTALICLSAVGLVTWVSLTLPLHWLRAIDIFGAFTLEFASALVGPVMTWTGLAQRLAVLLMAAGLLALAAAIHPRLDGGSKRSRSLVGAALLGAGLLAQAAAVAEGPLGMRAQEGWVAAHEEHRDDPLADLVSISGDLWIRPGASLRLDVELELTGRAGDPPLERLLFSLNPDLAIQSVAAASGGELEFAHGHGLLEVRLGAPLNPGDTTRLQVKAEGIPNVFFGYLDSADNFAEQSALDSQVVLLGTDSGVFKSSYVALMPGLHWLPTPGADVGRGDPVRRPPDFFEVDLTVEVPQGWLTAGPGRRLEANGAGAGNARFRYSPGAPVPQVALLAAPFERRSTEVRGVELEVLVDPDHARNLEVLADAGEEIRAWADELLGDAADLGLPYPYGAFTLVEVPNRLRGYEGGWRMDTAMAQPAMALMRESGFPTARFDTRFRNPQSFEDREGGLPRAKREALEEFFESDLSGGNVFALASRSFFGFLTAAEGPEGVALNHVLDHLALRLVTGKEAFFSAHLYDRGVNTLVGAAVANYMTNRGDGVSLASAVIDAAIDRPEVWEQATTSAMTALDPWQDPKLTVNVMALRGGALARSLLDGLGHDQVGRLLGELRARYAGAAFGERELLSVAEELGIDLQALLGDWLDEAALPGFVVSDARRFRLPDAEDGTPRYQVSIHVRNPEPAPGLVRLRYRSGQEGPEVRWESGAPVRVPAGEAVQIGLVTSRAIQRLELDPYLSLNRGPFEISLPAADETVVDADPLRGAAPSDWRPADDGSVIVDDLDPGFSIQASGGGTGLRLGGSQSSELLDQGLPIHSFGPPPAEWSRIESRTAWGLYRHTASAVRATRGEGSRAVFAATLERSGPWRLALHLPASHEGFGGWNRGSYAIAVVDDSGRHELSFDAAAAQGGGWNEVGEVEVASGEVRVELASATDGAAVIADAIRWQPRGGSALGADATSH
jgi:hypothetical protein